MNLCNLRQSFLHNVMNVKFTYEQISECQFIKKSLWHLGGYI